MPSALRITPTTIEIRASRMMTASGLPPKIVLLSMTARLLLISMRPDTITSVKERPGAPIAAYMI
jgi:hypothetical protein